MLKELGTYKQKIIAALSTSENIKTLLLGDNYENEDYDVNEELEKYIMPFLYTEGTQTNEQSYIFVETYAPKLSTSIKNMQIVIEILTYRSLIDYYKEGYLGTRPDICSQMIEEILIDNKEIARDFGIGNLTLNNVGILDNFVNYYGRILTFTIPDFR